MQAETYIRSLTTALHEAGTALGRNAVKAHMTFVIAYVYPALVQDGKQDLAFQVIADVIFPFLLFSKPRQKTASAVWDLMAANGAAENSVGKSDLLGGCVDAMKWQENKKTLTNGDGTHSVDAMARFNIAIASKIASE